MASKLSPTYVTRKLLSHPYWKHDDNTPVSLQHSARHTLTAVEKLAESCASMPAQVTAAITRLRESTEELLSCIERSEAGQGTKEPSVVHPAGGSDPAMNIVPEVDTDAYLSPDSVIPDQILSPGKPWIATTGKKSNRHKR